MPINVEQDILHSSTEDGQPSPILPIRLKGCYQLQRTTKQINRFQSSLMTPMQFIIRDRSKNSTPIHFKSSHVQTRICLGGRVAKENKTANRHDQSLSSWEKQSEERTRPIRGGHKTSMQVGTVSFVRRVQSFSRWITCEEGSQSDSRIDST